MSLVVVPITLKAARLFVARHHRHHPAPPGGLFAASVADEMTVGVAIVGRPVARALDDGLTAEITRVCVLPGNHNGCSMLYGACRRAAKALGYQRIVTYTLASERGTSLKASGFRCVGEVPPRADPDPWATQLGRTGKLFTEPQQSAAKLRWESV